VLLEEALAQLVSLSHFGGDGADDGRVILDGKRVNVRFVGAARLRVLLLDRLDRQRSVIPAGLRTLFVLVFF